MLKLLLIPAVLLLSGCTTSGSYAAPESDYSRGEEYEHYEYEAARLDDPTTERSFEETGDRDCEDFGSQDDAQNFFDNQDDPDSDFHNLDRDGDGVVCETLP